MTPSMFLSIQQCDIYILWTLNVLYKGDTEKYFFLNDVYEDNDYSI